MLTSPPMLMLTALKSRPLRNLWLGQIGSTMGDELYKMAYLWIAAGFLGPHAGWATSVNLAVATACALMAGRWFDHHRPDQTLLRLDVIRALLCLIPAIPYLWGAPSVPTLLWITLIISGLSGIFEPTLQSALPLLTRSSRELRAGNNLMATTYRMSRVTAPFLIGVLSHSVPIAIFFVIDSVSFLFSAQSIRTLKNDFHFPHVTPTEKSKTHLKDGIVLLLKSKKVLRAMIAKGLVAGLWYVSYTLGFVLLSRELNSGGLATYGLIMGSYGAGNLASALIFGNTERKHSEGWLYCGILLIGIAFICIGLSHSLVLVCAFAALCATGGPLNDTPMLELIQSEFPVTDQLKIIRLRWVSENFFMLLASLASPFVFHRFGTRNMLIFSGVCSILIAGLAYDRARKDGTSS